MNFKKVIALVSSLLMIFSLAACNNNSETGIPAESTTSDANQSVTDTVSDETDVTSTTSADVSETSVSTESEENSTSAVTTTTTTTARVSNDPTDWSTERIVEEYKKAALKSHAGTKSQHKIKIEEIKVNGKNFDGVTKIMDKLLANNSEDKDGITGGYQSLSTKDVKKATAYKSGNNTVIEMNMKDQVSGPHESDKSGSVGHAITVVGDISSVTKQLTDLNLPLELNDKETKIYYTDATVKAVINEDGKIIKGTWEYTVEIRLNNYKAFGQAVDSTSILMINTLTVNGGF
ncbi:MAG: hypothetical protein IJZ88_00710 [Clostridia bacterium]|nr:hypothetical protein [Clostridia bacterium]